jgi:hypothetical protein
VIETAPHDPAPSALVLTFVGRRLANAVSQGLDSTISTITTLAHGLRNREPFETAIDFHCGGGQGVADEGRRGAAPAGERLGPWSSDSQWARNPLLFSQVGVVHATPRVMFLSVLEDESPRRRRGRGTPIRPPTPTGPASQALVELRRYFTAQGTTLASH